LNRRFFIIIPMIIILLAACGKEPVTISELPGDVTPVAAEPAVTASPVMEEPVVEEPPAKPPPPEPQETANIKILTPTSVDYIDFAIYSEGVFTIKDGYGEAGNGRYGFMRSDGTEIAGYEYEYAYPFSEGLACVKKDGKYGFIDTNGDTALPFIYDNATPFSEGLAYFETDDTYGFIGQNGDTAFLLDCDSVSSFKEGLAFFSVDGKYGYIDTSGNVAIDAAFDDAGFFVDGLAKVRVGNSFGFIGKAGEFIVEPVYDDVNVGDVYADVVIPDDAVARGKYFRVKLNDMIGILDIGGGIVLPPEYTRIEPLPGIDAYIVNIGGGYGIIGSDGTVKTSDIYDYLEYENGLITASLNGKYGFLDAADLSVAIPFIYDSVYGFDGGFARVSLGDKQGVTDRQGNVVIPVDYEWIRVFTGGTFAVQTGGKYRLTDSSGKSINDMLFDTVQRAGDGYKVQVYNKYRFLDSHGKELPTPAYDRCYNDVLGMDNCFVASNSYGAGNQSIVILGELWDADLSDMLLRIEITPRIKPLNRFLKENSGGGFTSFYKLYYIDGGIPIMNYYARPAVQSGFPLSKSGFYSIKGDELDALITGYECGGSMGGEFTCFWRDEQTRKVYVGRYFHYGGFGGGAYGGEVYEHKNGGAVLLISLGTVSQTLRNYDEEELLEGTDMLYDSDSVPYTKEKILQAREDFEDVTEYAVNGERVTAEKWNEVYGRYKILALWSWPGY